MVLQSATAILLQSATSVIAKCEKRYYKVRKVLQSVTVHGVTFGHFSGSRTLVMVQQFMRQKLSRFSPDCLEYQKDIFLTALIWKFLDLFHLRL